MAHWNETAVTNDGVEMLNEWMAGRKITIVAAYGGTGTVDPALLTEQTELVNVQQNLYLLDEEDGADGKTVLVQVQNADVAEEYELNQVGIYAALDADRDPEAQPRLLFIMQDEKGVTIPAATEAAFMLELYCAIGITNNGRFEVSVSSAGIVTTAYLRGALERAFAAHNADKGAHNSMAVHMLALEIALNGSGTITQTGGPTTETEGDKGQRCIDPETGEEFVCDGLDENGYIWKPAENGRPIRDALGATESIEAGLTDVRDRMTMLELMYRTQVNGNPFSALFSDLTGLVCTGVWNQALGRLEF